LDWPNRKQTSQHRFTLRIQDCSERTHHGLLRSDPNL
jgi:hypothetical protein